MRPLDFILYLLCALVFLEMCFINMRTYWSYISFFLTAHSDMNVVTILVGNKSDLKDAREVKTAEGKSLAEAHGLFFIETSALDSSNVASAFQMVVKEIYNILSRKVIQSQELKHKETSRIGNGKTVVIQADGDRETDGQNKKGWCCSS